MRDRHERVIALTQVRRVRAAVRDELRRFAFGLAKLQPAVRNAEVCVGLEQLTRWCRAELERIVRSLIEIAAAGLEFDISAGCEVGSSLFHAFGMRSISTF